ncbi:MAG: antitoxin family protein [Pirellulales bacterium]
MSKEFDAIYENGVLRPLTPVALREHEVVTVSIAPSSHSREDARTVSGTSQQERLLAFVAKMESLVDEVPPDGLSGRDHDRLIYNGPG